MTSADSHTFPRSHRLRSRGEFSRVFDARVRESRGPVTFYSVPNDLPHPRLGLSLSRKVGTAVRRNRIKRLLREAFRLRQHELPAGFDIVVVVRPHEPLPLAVYQAMMLDATGRLARVWAKRT